MSRTSIYLNTIDLRLSATNDAMYAIYIIYNVGKLCSDLAAPYIH